MNTMKIFFFIICLAVTGCYTIKTNYDFDLLADFSKYNTYSFSEQSLDYKRLIDGERLLMAIEKEMSKHGFTKSDDPDILIDLYVKLEQKSATVVPPDTPSPWARGYGVGFKVTEVTTENYDEGTLVISVLDIRQQKIVWQGRAKKTIKEKALPKAKKKRIDKAVALIFESYPFRYK